MKWLFCLAFLFFSLLSNAQQLVYTVVGSDTSTAYVTLGDGGPATAAVIGSTEGIWLDCNSNLYISDMGDSRIRKVNGATGIITTIAGTRIGGVGFGFSGDGGPATDAQIKGPYGLYSDATGNVYFSDRNNFRIRRIDAVTGIITTVAGGGITLGDGGPATNAQLTDPPSVYGDDAGNLYISDKARIRKVKATTGIITTIAGTGVTGFSGDGGPATNAQLYYPIGMILDAHNHLYIADRGNAVIRKIDITTGIINTIAGTTQGYSGDGGLATNAQISSSNSIAIDTFGNLIIGDLQNDVIRKVDAITGIITTIAGDTSLSAMTAEGAAATATSMHPEFIYLDRKGNLLYSNFGRQIRKIINCNPALPSWSNTCVYNAVQQLSPNKVTIEIYPNPVSDVLHIKMAAGAYNTMSIVNSIGQLMMQRSLAQAETEVAVNAFPPGVYYITFKGEHGVSVRRFVKE